MRPSSSRTLSVPRHTHLSCRAIARRRRVHILFHTHTFTRPPDGVVIHGTARTRRLCGLRGSPWYAVSFRSPRRAHVGAMRPSGPIALRGSKQTPMHCIAPVITTQCASGTPNPALTRRRSRSGARWHRSRRLTLAGRPAVVGEWTGPNCNSAACCGSTCQLSQSWGRPTHGRPAVCRHSQGYSDFGLEMRRLRPRAACLRGRRCERSQASARLN